MGIFTKIALLTCTIFNFSIVKVPPIVDNVHPTFIIKDIYLQPEKGATIDSINVSINKSSVLNVIYLNRFDVALDSISHDSLRYTIHMRVINNGEPLRLGAIKGAIDLTFTAYGKLDNIPFECSVKTGYFISN